MTFPEKQVCICMGIVAWIMVLSISGIGIYYGIKKLHSYASSHPDHSEVCLYRGESRYPQVSAVVSKKENTK